MRIAIFGCGGVGGYFGARLAQAGEDVVFIARGEHLRVMQNSGLQVDSVAGDFHIGNLSASDRPDQVGAVDAVILGVKTWQVGEAALVTGSVVVSLDYFKRFIAGLRALIGGRIKTYEPLLDRARREALLRMKEEARDRGFDAIINVRLHTSRLANSRGNGEGTAGVEVLAFGTGLSLNRR